MVNASQGTFLPAESNPAQRSFLVARLREFIRPALVIWLLSSLGVLVSSPPLAVAQGEPSEPAKSASTADRYAYETKPDDAAFEVFNPRRAPAPGPLLLRSGDRLAICGDSITEQKMYSRIIETYLTVCVPELAVTVRQYGWSGEKTDGFLQRMEQDCLTFQPTVATLAYGMNDTRYRPFDVTNGQWYEDHLTAIVKKFKEHEVRVVVGSPGCAGKIAEWVRPRAGSLQDHNLHLCALRDIGLGVAQQQDVRFADIFWPMLQAQVFAPGQHQATADHPYYVAGDDGIHPEWAGQVIMAWSFLRALGLSGDLGTISVDMQAGKATATGDHTIDRYEEGKLQITSRQYPFCARGDLHSHKSIRSGMTLVPFMEDLNRFVLKAEGLTAARYRVTWGPESREFSADELQRGILLAKEFPDNPFVEAFDRVDEAVARKQAFETHQVKEVFHGAAGRDDFAQAVQATEAQRAPLAAAIQQARVPVQHQLTLQALND